MALVGMGLGACVGRNDIDPMMAINPTVGSPDKGQSNGTGSFDGLGMDLRDDTIQ